MASGLKNAVRVTVGTCGRGAPSPAPEKVDDHPLPSEGEWYVADIFSVPPPEAGNGGCEQEICRIGFKAMSAAEAYRRASVRGQTHATEAFGEVRFLGISCLATVVDQTNLLTPEKSAKPKWMREDLWPNAVGGRTSIQRLQDHRWTDGGSLALTANLPQETYDAS